MYKRLIDEKFESYNEQGRNLDGEVLEILSPILEKYIAEGFSSNDIETIALNTIQLKMATLRIIRAIELRKKEREDANILARK